jgi:hypothetical protein
MKRPFKILTAIILVLIIAALIGFKLLHNSKKSSKSITTIANVQNLKDWLRTKDSIIKEDYRSSFEEIINDESEISWLIITPWYEGFITFLLDPNHKNEVISSHFEFQLHTSNNIFKEYVNEMSPFSDLIDSWVSYSSNHHLDFEDIVTFCNVTLLKDKNLEYPFFKLKKGTAKIKGFELYFSCDKYRFFNFHLKKL